MNVKIHHFSIRLCILSRTTVQQKCDVAFLLLMGINSNSIVAIPHHNTFDTFNTWKTNWKNFLKIFSTLFAFALFQISKIFSWNLLRVLIYWNWINFIMVNAKFSQKFFQIFLKFYSKFISSFLRISFRIYLKYLKYFYKVFATFIPENFPEICENFSRNFLKNLVKI